MEETVNNIFNIVLDQLSKIKSVEKKKQIGQGIIQKLVKHLLFELHIPGYNYCGPGTKLEKRLKRRDKGINRVDEVCKTHDINYYSANSNDDYKKADQQMLSELNQIENPTVGETLCKFIAEKGIKAKLMLGSGSQAYCLTCKQFTDSIEAENIIYKNGRNMEISRCKTCNRKLSKFLKNILESAQAGK